MTHQQRINKPNALTRIGKLIIILINELINIAVLGIFVLLLVYGSYVLYQNNRIYQSADADVYAMYRPTAANEGISFSSLQQINPDVISWLTIYGTNIDYPITQTDNNETYVNTNVMGEYAMTGSIFLDYHNAADFSDFSSIVYGHHMEKNTMFGGIEQFSSPEYLSDHLYGNLYFSGKDHGLELFAFLDVDAYDSSVYMPVVSDGMEQDFVANLIAKSVHNKDISIKPGDHIVLLSTCTSTSTNGRHILVGKITDTVYPDPYASDESEHNPIIKAVDSKMNSNMEHLPLWKLAIPGILLILIILYLICSINWKEHYDKRKHKKI